MKNLNILLILSFIISSCSPKTGTAKYGEDGKMISKTTPVRCTLVKNYSSSIDAKVKASIDSLQGLPKASVDMGVTKTVTKLFDYSSDGVDLDLILFHICEMSNNMGYTAAESESLFKAASDAWAKKKDQPVNTGVNNGVIGNTIINNGVIGDNNHDITINPPILKEQPPKDNYIITRIIDSAYFRENPAMKFIFEIKPKKGQWSNVYILVPTDETHVTVDDPIYGNLVSATTGAITGFITPPFANGKTMSGMRLLNGIVRPDVPCYLTLRFFPSVIGIGNYGDPDEFYLTSKF